MLERLQNQEAQLNGLIGDIETMDNKISDNKAEISRKQIQYRNLSEEQRLCKNELDDLEDKLSCLTSEELKKQLALLLNSFYGGANDSIY
jgi:chromosome segregation ATPase